MVHAGVPYVTVRVCALWARVNACGVTGVLKGIATMPWALASAVLARREMDVGPGVRPTAHGDVRT